METKSLLMTFRQNWTLSKQLEVYKHMKMCGNNIQNRHIINQTYYLNTTKNILQTQQQSFKRWHQRQNHVLDSST